MIKNVGYLIICSSFRLRSFVRCEIKDVTLGFCSPCWVFALSSSVENCSEEMARALQISSRLYGSACSTSSTRASISSREAFNSVCTWASFNNLLEFRPRALASIWVHTSQDVSFLNRVGLFYPHETHPVKYLQQHLNCVFPFISVLQYRYLHDA